MSSVFKPTSLKPVPEGAVPCTIRGRPGVAYTDGRGRRHERPVKPGRDGTVKMVVEQSRWWMRYVLADGTPIRCKGFRDRAATEQAAFNREREAEQRAAGLIPVDREHLQAPITQHIEDFIQDKIDTGKSERYWIQLQSRTLRAVRECDWPTLGSITTETFQKFLGRVRREHPQGRTAMHHWDAVTEFMRWCVKRHRLLANPLATVERVKNPEPTYTRRALSVDEARQLLAVSGPRAILYHCAMRTGLRRSELLGLLWQQVHVDAQDQIPHFAIPGSLTKNRRPAIIRLTGDLAEELRRHRPTDAGPRDRVFRRMPKMKTYRRDLQKAGIKDRMPDGSRVDFHSLRVTFCTHLLSMNAPVAATMTVMRHSDPRLTLKTYMDATQLNIGAIVDALPSLLDGAGHKPSQPTPETHQRPADTDEGGTMKRETKQEDAAAPPPGEPTLLLTLSEVGHSLRVSTRQVHRLLSSGRLPPADVTLGGRRGHRWRRDQLEAWVKAGCPRADAWLTIKRSSLGRSV